MGNRVLNMPVGRPFRILQLTDLHIGGSVFTAKKDAAALDAVERLIKAATPDLVAMTGDICYPIPIFSGTTDNLRPLKRLARLLEALDVYWAPVFGNHDCESFSRYEKAEICAFYESLPKCLFERGPAEVSGEGNYSLRLENPDGTLNTLLMFLDSHAYLTKSFFSGFDVIRDDQIDWYKREVAAAAPSGSAPARSLAFFHIPPKEFKEAWEKCYRGEPDAEYRLGFVGEKDNYFGHAKTKEGNFFNEMAEFGSCKGMFMGHDHLNTLSLVYRGIRLTYGMSIDYLAYRGIKKKSSQRGGTLIEIGEGGDFEVSLLPLSDII